MLSLGALRRKDGPGVTATRQRTRDAANLLGGSPGAAGTSASLDGLSDVGQNEAWPLLEIN